MDFQRARLSSCWLGGEVGNAAGRLSGDGVGVVWCGVGVVQVKLGAGG